ncbi:HAMP domain-containing histidine kinase [Acidaminobacter sp. JC074]|uniref:sensor histidine kinase n=1 Tax=Acidaminobacter sp. JC074 TaxID=2530199 RepID=UPI001F0EC806|nr:HAMP domain-containing sensor histidine kinase [Acidaminobacter sp. JC074]MCH4887804.1 HAMP domain-containing histidine kinase [Acidaminobacter sp. JC074]
MKIKSKLIIIMFTIIVSFLGILLLLNRFFLEDYYVLSIRDDFESDVKAIKEIDQDDKRLAYLKEQNNLKGYKYQIANDKGKVILSSVPEFRANQDMRLPNSQVDYIRKNKALLDDGVMTYFIMEHEDDINRQVLSYSKLSKDRFLIISNQLRHVRSSAHVAIEFFMMTGLLVSLVILVITFFLSKKIVDPILMINRETKKLSELNFDIDVHLDSKDELGQLSNSIQIVAAALDEKITALNLANDRLKNDMVHQRQFLASIAHEFKSPIGIIKGYTESVKLKYYKSDDEMQTFLNYVLEESDQLTGLVEDIVDLAKLDKRDFVLDMQTINLKKLLEKEVNKYKHLFDDKDIEVISSLDNLEIQGDIKRLEQIIDNLLSNAYHYTKPQGQIYVNLHKGLVIKNTCDVIEKDKLDLLTNPFYRLEASRSKETGGHGLGLSIVDGLVKAHHGDMELDYDGNMFIVKVNF